MFHIIINDLGDSTWNMLIKFGGDTKLRSTESAQESRKKPKKTLQNYSDKLNLCSQKGEKKRKKDAIPTGSCAKCSLSQE